MAEQDGRHERSVRVPADEAEPAGGIRTQDGHGQGA